MRTVIAGFIVMMLVGCANICPCPSDTLYIHVPVVLWQAGYSHGTTLVRIIKIDKGDLDKNGWTREEMQDWFKGAHKVVYGVNPIAHRLLTDKDIEEFGK